uniref:Uncharacterized protein n=1 Tax=Chromera velia CCMP2878 TaxID=1169474 RepID=A0A0G4IFV7_9ALVE|eukprot:Cvel_14033.t1-p1 / transcript=Cvel_14033.t1 / gene=Cvel_14033 / organism=Chromera_velia_CCMP2878 / gene_product=Dosage compensation protein dpy-30, putative / transcript_product=Dosage compensation protein dpy-30, putative / location=Cvel_scaffold983:27663-35318(-) / protein_length=227 / sequence_SO=supercontig / SO=protein_coding / is_pseudo=false
MPDQENSGQPATEENSPQAQPPPPAQQQPAPPSKAYPDAEAGRGAEKMAMEAHGELHHQAMPVRQYLDQTVVPTLLPALNEVAMRKPDDPIEFLADFDPSEKSKLEEAKQDTKALQDSREQGMFRIVTVIEGKMPYYIFQAALAAYERQSPVVGEILRGANKRNPKNTVRFLQTPNLIEGLQLVPINRIHASSAHAMPRQRPSSAQAAAAAARDEEGRAADPLLFAV